MMSTNPDQIAASDSEAIRAKIVGENYVEIRRNNPGIAWEEEVHALNWFNTRSMAVYNFYNLIAGRSVKRVGGKPLFKGRLTKSLLGDKKDSRDVLLIVRYPSANHFRSMLENTYFKIVSLLRTVSVSDFTFCLSKKTSAKELVPESIDSRRYLVHHFRGDQQAIVRAREAVDGTPVALVFSSLKSHGIASVSKDQSVTPIPDLMDGVLVFCSSDVESLEQFFLSDSYRAVIQSTDSSFLGLLRRLI